MMRWFTMLLVLAAIPAAAGVKASASSDGQFTVSLPKGYASRPAQGHVFAWRSAVDSGMFSRQRPPALADPLKLARRRRAQYLRQDPDTPYGMVEKKTLKNGAVFYFFWSGEPSSDPQHRRHFEGAIDIGGEVYLVNGTVQPRRFGMNSVGRVLDAVKPTGKGKLRGKGIGKPSAINAKDEKARGVPIGDGAGSIPLLR